MSATIPTMDLVTGQVAINTDNPAGSPGQFLQRSQAHVPVWAGGTFAAITTATAINITANNAYSGGNITADGGPPYSRGSSGYYWCTIMNSNSNGQGLTSYTGGSYLNPYNKAYGFALRCVHD